MRCDLCFCERVVESWCHKSSPSASIELGSGFGQLELITEPGFERSNCWRQIFNHQCQKFNHQCQNVNRQCQNFNHQCQNVNRQCQQEDGKHGEGKFPESILAFGVEEETVWKTNRKTLSLGHKSWVEHWTALEVCRDCSFCSEVKHFSNQKFFLAEVDSLVLEVSKVFVLWRDLLARLWEFCYSWSYLSVLLQQVLKTPRVSLAKLNKTTEALGKGH